MNQTVDINLTEPLTPAEEPFLLKKTWTKVEDSKLLSLVHENGITGSWSLISNLMGGRSGKQCRERYHNHLKPEIKKGGWTKEEDQLIIQLQKEMGNQWAKLSKHLPGRSDNAVKNRWHIKTRPKTPKLKTTKDKEETYMEKTKKLQNAKEEHKGFVNRGVPIIPKLLSVSQYAVPSIGSSYTRTVHFDNGVSYATSSSATGASITSNYNGFTSSSLGPSNNLTSVKPKSLSKPIVPLLELSCIQIKSESPDLMALYHSHDGYEHEEMDSSRSDAPCLTVYDLQKEGQLHQLLQLQLTRSLSQHQLSRYSNASETHNYPCNEEDTSNTHEEDDWLDNLLYQTENSEDEMIREFNYKAKLNTNSSFNSHQQERQQQQQQLMSKEFGQTQNDVAFPTTYPSKAFIHSNETTVQIPVLLQPHSAASSNASFGPRPANRSTDMVPVDDNENVTDCSDNEMQELKQFLSRSGSNASLRQSEIAAVSVSASQNLVSSGNSSRNTSEMQPEIILQSILDSKRFEITPRLSPMRGSPMFVQNSKKQRPSLSAHPSPKVAALSTAFTPRAEC